MFTVFVMSVVLLFHFTFMLYSMTSFEGSLTLCIKQNNFFNVTVHAYVSDTTSHSSPACV